MKTYIVRLSLMAAFLVLFPACELERLPAATEVAPGGGTLTTYTAYSINSTDTYRNQRKRQDSFLENKSCPNLGPIIIVQYN